MIKISKQKLLTTTILLALLTISGGYMAILPTAHAQDITNSQKATELLGNVVGFNMTAYTTDLASESNSNTSKTSALTAISSLPQDDLIFNLTADHGGLTARCLFINGSLNLIYLSNYAGVPSLNSPTRNSLANAQGFLQRYQSFTGNSFYGSLGSMLDNVVPNTNMTMAAGNIKLQAYSFGNQTEQDLVWTYVDSNNAPALMKDVVLTYSNGHLESFLDNWQLYQIANVPTVTSKQDAITAALQAANIFSYSTQNANGVNVTVSGFKVAAVYNASLSYVNGLEQNPKESISGGDIYMLYPSWYVAVGFNKLYPGGVAGLNVWVSADTGDVSSVEPIVWSSPPNASSTIAPSLNVTPIQSEISQSSIMRILLPLTATTAGSLIVGCLFAQKNKMHSFKRSWKMSLSKRKVVSVCLILLPVTLMVIVPNAAASTLKSETYISTAGYPNTYGSFDQNEIAASENIGAGIQGNYTPIGVNSGLTDFSPTAQNADETITNNIVYDEGCYPDVEVFAFGNGYNPNYILSNQGNNITTTQIASATNNYQTISFIWQFMCTGAGVNVGTPNFDFATAWTQTDLSNNYLNDGFNFPDNSGHCFIGFEHQAPMVGNPYYSFEGYIQPAYLFPEWFYEAATSCNTVHDSLNIASEMFFGQPYDSSPIANGYSAYWPGGDGFDPGWIFQGKMMVFGDSNIYISPETPETVSTPTISGPDSGTIDTSYQLGVSSTVNYYGNYYYGKTVAYLIDWGDGTQSLLSSYYTNGDTEYFDHTYTSTGDFSITVYAVSSDNVWSTPNTYPVSISGQSATLTVNTSDDYSCSMPANIYVDGNWVGYSSGSTYLPLGWHYISADNPVWDDNYGAYAIIVSGSGWMDLTGDTTVTIYYGEA